MFRVLSSLFCFVLSYVFLSHSATAQVTELKVAVSGYSGVQREAFLALSNDFHQANPDITVGFTLTEDSIFKNRLNDWLSQHNEFDLVIWHAGERLRAIAKQGYVYPLTKIWEQGKYSRYFSEAMAHASSYDNVPYGIPISTYQWGFYYNKSLFQEHNLEEPKTWSEFKALIVKLKKLDIIPIIVASGSGWPVAGWYEYINLRANGLEAQTRLNDLQLPINKKEVTRVLKHLKSLIELESFADHHRMISWKSSLPAIFRGQVAMALYGNFLESALPRHVADSIGYFPFPQIEPFIDNFEIAPTDILLITQNSQHKAASERFVQYAATPEVQEKLNLKLNQISPNKLSKISDTTPLAKEGVEILRAADGFSQYFDREVSKELSDDFIRIWIDFMDNPDIPATVQKMEKAKLRLRTTADK